MTSRRWNTVTKIIVSSTLVLLAIALLITFRVMIAPTIVAFLLSFILSYPVNWIQRRTGWARTTTVAVLYVVLIALLAITPALFISRLMEMINSLQTALESLIVDLQAQANLPLLGGLNLPVDQLLQDAGALLINILASITSNPFLVAREVTSRILTVIYVSVLNFWLLKDMYKLQRFMLDQVPSDLQEDVRRLAQELSMIWNAFLRGQIVLALVVGVITWVALVIVGMPNAGGLALLAGFMEFLPTVGPGLSATIGVALSLFSKSSTLGLEGFSFALVVLVVYMIQAQYETINLIPRLVGRRVRLHPAVTFVGVISSALVFGLLGVLLATPLIASTRTILSYIYAKLFDLEPFEQTASSQTTVRIRGLIAGRKIEGIVFDLDGAVAQLNLGLIDTVVERTSWIERLVNEAQRRHIVHRLLVMLEVPVHFLMSQLIRFELYEELERFLPTFNRLRGHAKPEQMEAVPQVLDALTELAPHYRLGLISTRNRFTIDQFLDRSGLNSGLFDTVIAQEDVRNLMPHVEGLMKISDAWQLPPNTMLVVSDTDANLRSGRAANMATAGVLSGLGERSDLEDADIIIDDATELCEWL
ncbi:MAG: AI-2E family transporter [Caldilineaceae bacterium]|nr:AI-2E family transporter [Caldilineaceae bacterium]